MTTSKLAALIGQEGKLSVETGSDHLRIPVRVLDARITFGRIHVLVSPLTPDGGDGCTWVDADRILGLQEATS